MNIIIVLILWIIFIAGLYFYLNKTSTTIDIEKKKEVLDNTVQEEYEKKCKFVFIKCREKNLSSFDTPEKLEILKIIAGSYGIDDIEEAKKCYEIGKPLVENAEMEEEKKMLNELRRKDQNEFEDAEKRANIKGKEKYISYLEKLYQEALKTAKLAGEKIDEDEDEEQEQDVKAKKDELSSSVSEAYSTVSAYKLALNNHKAAIDKFHQKICDDSNIEEKFSHLEFSNLKCLVLKSRNIRVSGFVRLKEKLQLLGTDALLDGSIKITIIDPEGNELGFEYYSTGSFDAKGALIQSGFTEYEKRFSAICIINDYEKVSEAIEYTFKIEPVNMWLIEC